MDALDSNFIEGLSDLVDIEAEPLPSTTQLLRGRIRAIIARYIDILANTFASKPLNARIRTSNLGGEPTYPRGLWVTVSLCVLCGDIDSSLYKRIHNPGMLPILKSVFLAAYRRNDYQLQLPTLTLAYKLCQIVPQTIEALDYIQYTRDMADEAYNYAATKLIVSRAEVVLPIAALIIRFMPMGH
ncbi:hypothetical protein EV182_003457 [Spiromyces aspiralis]|uniref:Uncharacterized protein n=1 Tax=Spiromyces aspiralis TaxID=68401 RepID=A0ACC1HQD7_9FUNG|nr:hypothetical protein EV182_003457 [Spiromyces aspiralis]